MVSSPALADVAGLEAAFLACMAALLAALLLWAAPLGTDFAAHAYGRTVFLRHGFQLWNNLWYAGHYSFITYSLLYYPLAALLGIKLLAVTTVAVGTLAFSRVLGGEWGADARWSTIAFAAVWAAFVLTAAFPFALGMSLALLAIWALQRNSRWLFAALSGLSLAASPLAFLLLALLLVAIALAHRPVGKRLVWPAITIAAWGGVEVLLWRVFPSSGRFPFSTAELLMSLAYCASVTLLTWRIERARLLRFILLAFGAACLAAYFVPSAVGQNVARFRFVALPLTVLALSLARWRPRVACAAVLILTLVWNITPLVAGLLRSDEAAQAAYWGPAVGFLEAHLTPSYRVEVVDSAHHWGAVYLPRAGIPLARGWYRQDDFPQNEPLYEKLTARKYLDWLRSLGVRYVVLTNSVPDYSAHREAALVRSGRSGLRPVFRNGDVTILSVPTPRRLVSGPAPASVLSFQQTRFRLRLGGAGSYGVAVRYSPYWQSSVGCIARSKTGMIRLTVPRAGVVSLAFEVSAGRALDVLTNNAYASCRGRQP